MPLRRALRAVLFAGVCLAVWACARPARAAVAPLCDDRGASAFAPPPMLESPEDVLAQAPRDACEYDALSPLATIGNGRGAGVSMDSDGAAALPADALRVPAPSCVVSAIARPPRERPPASVRSRVERPPRV